MKLIIIHYEKSGKHQYVTYPSTTCTVLQQLTKKRKRNQSELICYFQVNNQFILCLTTSLYPLDPCHSTTLSVVNCHSTKLSVVHGTATVPSSLLYCGTATVPLPQHHALRVPVALPVPRSLWYCTTWAISTLKRQPSGSPLQSRRWKWLKENMAKSCLPIRCVIYCLWNK